MQTVPTIAAAQAEEHGCPPGTPFSFELFPPRSDAGQLILRDTILRLAATGPDFISVTYGAGGSSRQKSLDVLRFILEQTDVHPMAHLTCVGSSHHEANRLVREFLDSGITSFLALRGDPPAGASEGDPFLGDLGSASELVQLIHRVQAERAQYATLGSRDGGVKGAIPAHRATVRVAVATFPNGHLRDRRRDQDIDTLLAKQTAGATMAITQLFFEADDYLSFVARAVAGGVTIPILPGLMPATSPGRLRRILELTRESAPVDLERRLGGTDDADEQLEIGVEHATRLAARLVEGGAPGLHLYTFNQHAPVVAVLDRLGLLSKQPEYAHRRH